MKKIEEIFPLLDQPKKIVIVMHLKPDADAMGSSLGLFHFLNHFGHTINVISPTNWAEWLKWMPGANVVIDYEFHTDKANKVLDNADWVFCLDFNTLVRTRHMAQKLKKLGAVKILIDHHQEPAVDDFVYGVSDTGKSSTSEMIYDFIVASGNAEKINIPIAECLYAGVMTDTGSFRFVGHVLQNRMDIYYEYNAALISNPWKDLVKYEIKTGDTEGLVNYPLTIKGIKLVALIIDRDEEIKCSFRSKDDFDVNTFARKYFEGGGHFNAAGGRSSGTLEQTVQQFIRAMKESELQLQQS